MLQHDADTVLSGVSFDNQFCVSGSLWLGRPIVSGCYDCIGRGRLRDHRIKECFFGLKASRCHSLSGKVRTGERSRIVTGCAMSTGKLSEGPAPDQLHGTVSSNIMAISGPFVFNHLVHILLYRCACTAPRNTSSSVNRREIRYISRRSRLLKFFISFCA